MAPPFSMSRLWHHVSIPAEVDGFLIPSPTWLPRFVHVFILSLSLSLPLSLFSFFSPPQRRSLSRRRARSLSRRLLSPLLSGTRACVTGGGVDFSFLSSLLVLFFSSLPLSSPLFIARGRNRFSLLLFFLSLSPSLPHFLQRPKSSRRRRGRVRRCRASEDDVNVVFHGRISDAVQGSRPGDSVALG